MLSAESPDNELVDELASRDPIDLKALDDIFSGNTKDISYYYGDSAFDPSEGSTYWAEVVAGNHPESAREYLNIRDTDFKKNELGMNAITDYLVDEHGMDRRIVETVNSDYYKLLILVYHAMYDPDEGSISDEYDRLTAKTKIFKDNKEEVYYLKSETFDLDEVTAKARQYVREQNEDAKHAFAVQEFSEDDGEELVLKLFAESSRTGQRVFSFRKEGREEPPSEPSIEYDSTHNVKTMGVQARNVDGDTELTLSKSRQGWKADLGDFFESVFEIDDAWETLEEERVTGATRVIKEVKATADDEEATKRDVIDRADGVVDDLSEPVIESMQEDEEVTDEEIEEAEQLYEDITLIGFEIDDDPETGTARFNVEAEEEFETWMNNIDEIEAAAKALMARVEQENLNLIYEATAPDGTTNRFTVSDGSWSPEGRGMDEDTLDLIDRLLTASHDDE